MPYSAAAAASVFLEMSSATYKTTYDDAGEYKVTIKVTDGKDSVSQDVKVTVKNVNRPPILQDIGDLNIKEGDKVSITPITADPDKDNVYITYSIPLDNNGEWQTKEGDAGNYDVKVVASDNTLKGAYLPGKDTCPSFDDYAESITTALINSDIEPDNLPTLFLETGRALIDDAGYLTGTVLANKRLASGRRSTIIDVGINLLFTSFWYEHEVLPAQETSQQTEDTTIYGPLCMNIDVIRDAIQFPLLQKGDNFVIPRVGAYNMTQWMQFITLRPNIILIGTDGKIHVIREKENAEVFKSSEKTPEHLDKK